MKFRIVTPWVDAPRPKPPAQFASVTGGALYTTCDRCGRRASFARVEGSEGHAYRCACRCHRG